MIEKKPHDLVKRRGNEQKLCFWQILLRIICYDGDRLPLLAYSWIETKQNVCILLQICKHQSLFSHTRSLLRQKAIWILPKSQHKSFIKTYFVYIIQDTYTFDFDFDQNCNFLKSLINHFWKYNINRKKLMEIRWEPLCWVLV